MTDRATTSGGNALFELTLEAGYRFELEPRSVFTSATLLHARTPPRIVPDAMGAAAMPAAATARHASRGNALASRVLLWRCEDHPRRVVLVLMRTGA